MKNLIIQLLVSFFLVAKKSTNKNFSQEVKAVTSLDFLVIINVGSFFFFWGNLALPVNPLLYVIISFLIIILTNYFLIFKKKYKNIITNYTQLETFKIKKARLIVYLSYMISFLILFIMFKWTLHINENILPR